MANENACALRKRMTPQEVKLWVHLRSWRPRGFHFRRQSPRDGFILDFICLKHPLIIEVDGGQHNLAQHAKRDIQRDAKFSKDGFRILRFWNSEIGANLDGVLEVIDGELRKSIPHPAGFAGHPPPTGEG
jgi:very-short-patch-repair endonuclease